MADDVKRDTDTERFHVASMPEAIGTAVCEVMGAIGTLAKKEKNAHGNYKYTSIDDFLAATGPLCAEHGLIIEQHEVAFEIVGVADKNGETPWLFLTYDFTLSHKSGVTWDKITRKHAMVRASSGSQSFGQAQSYALKMYERSLFQIPTGEKDADANEQTTLPNKTSKPENDPHAGSKAYVKKVINALSMAETVADIAAIRTDQESSMKMLGKQSPDQSNVLEDAFTARIEALEAG